jgi:hypothetical protein
MGDLLYLFNPVDAGDADAFDLAVDQHLTGTAFADAAFEAAFAVTQAVTVNRMAPLMKSSCNCESYVTCNFLSFKQKCMLWVFLYLQDGVLRDLVHGRMSFEAAKLLIFRIQNSSYC